MQTSLFDDDNTYKSSFLRNLQSFSLDKSLFFLEKWSHTLSPPKNIAAMTGDLAKLLDDFHKEENKITFLCDLRQNQGTLKKYSSLIKYQLPLISGINARLAALLPFSDDYLQRALHSCEIYLAVIDYERALKSAHSYIEKQGEDARVRQAEGYALSRLNREDEAIYAYTLAYFYNPLECSSDYLGLKKVENKFNYLSRQYDDPEMAWLNLPFLLWKEGLTSIPIKADKYRQSISELLEPGIPNNAKERLLQFNRRLYLAESIRLMAGRGQTTEELLELRNEMQQLHPEKFISYINVLQHFGNL